MVSLIAATVNRVAELERLLASLDRQSYRDFEVIVVDQNDDDRLVPVLGKHAGLTIRHLRSGRGLSRARNVALPHAKGDIIAFPDDDCWYPDDLLAAVTDWFQAHPDFGGLFTILRDAENRPVGPKWPSGSRSCNKKDVWHCGISPDAFFRRQVTDAVGFFDERLGIGAATPYQSGEDLDYFLRPLALGFKLWYEPGLPVHHPSFHSVPRLLARSYSYSLGGAYVLRLHGFSWLYFAGLVVRSLGGAVVSLGKGNVRVAYAYLLRTAGQLRGYILGSRDLRKIEFPAHSVPIENNR
jgi:glycosyltransferase involved in cell wall biosynthesis